MFSQNANHSATAWFLEAFLWKPSEKAEIAHLRSAWKLHFKGFKLISWRERWIIRLEPSSLWKQACASRCFVYTLVTFMYSLIRVYSKLAKTIIFYRKFKGPKKYRFLIKIILSLERKIVQGRESLFWRQFRVRFWATVSHNERESSAFERQFGKMTV